MMWTASLFITAAEFKQSTELAEAIATTSEQHLHFTTSYGLPANTGEVHTIKEVAGAASDAATAAYTGLAGTSSANGLDATFDVTVAASAVTVTVNARGSGYQAVEVITIAKEDLTDATTDLMFKIDGLSATLSLETTAGLLKGDRLNAAADDELEILSIQVNTVRTGAAASSLKRGDSLVLKTMRKVLGFANDDGSKSVFAVSSGKIAFKGATNASILGTTASLLQIDTALTLNANAPDTSTRTHELTGAYSTTSTDGAAKICLIKDAAKFDANASDARSRRSPPGGRAGLCAALAAMSRLVRLLSTPLLMCVMCLLPLPALEASHADGAADIQVALMYPHSMTNRRAAVEGAVNDINANTAILPSHTIKLTHTSLDPACGTAAIMTTATIVADSDHKPVALVGPRCSSSAVASMALLGGHGIPTVSPSATLGSLSSTTDYPFFMRTAPTGEGRLIALSTFLKGKGLTSDGVTVLSANDAYSTGNAASFEAAVTNGGGVVVTTHTFTSNSATQIAAHLESMKVSSVNVLSAAESDLKLVLDQCGASGGICSKEGTVWVSLWDSPEVFSTLTPSQLAACTGWFWAASQDSSAPSFRARFGASTDFFASYLYDSEYVAYSYDAMHAIALALHAVVAAHGANAFDTASSNTLAMQRSRVHAALQAVDFEGVSGLRIQGSAATNNMVGTKVVSIFNIQAASSSTHTHTVNLNTHAVTAESNSAVWPGGGSTAPVIRLRIRFALFMPTTGWDSSNERAAMMVAAETINKDKSLLPLHLVVLEQAALNPGCDVVKATKALVELITNADQTLAIIGPGCSHVAVALDPMVSPLDLMMIASTALDSRLSDNEKFPMFSRTAPSTSFVATATFLFLKHFKMLNDVASLSSDEDGWGQTILKQTVNAIKTEGGSVASELIYPYVEESPTENAKQTAAINSHVKQLAVSTSQVFLVFGWPRALAKVISAAIASDLCRAGQVCVSLYSKLETDGDASVFKGDSYLLKRLAGFVWVSSPDASLPSFKERYKNGGDLSAASYSDYSAFAYDAVVAAATAAHLALTENNGDFATIAEFRKAFVTAMHSSKNRFEGRSGLDVEGKLNTNDMVFGKATIVNALPTCSVAHPAEPATGICVANVATINLLSTSMTLTPGIDVIWPGGGTTPPQMRGCRPGSKYEGEPYRCVLCTKPLYSQTYNSDTCLSCDKKVLYDSGTACDACPVVNNPSLAATDFDSYCNGGEVSLETMIPSRNGSLWWPETTNLTNGSLYECDNFTGACLFDVLSEASPYNKSVGAGRFNPLTTKYRRWCRRFHQGPLCMGCEDSLGCSLGACTPSLTSFVGAVGCNDCTGTLAMSFLTYLTYFICTFFFCTFLTYFISWSYSKQAGKFDRTPGYAVLLASLFDFGNLLSVLIGLRMRWHWPPLINLIAVSAISSGNMQGVFGCLTSSSHTMAALMACFSPLFTLLVFYLFYISVGKRLPRIHASISQGSMLLRAWGHICTWISVSIAKYSYQAFVCIDIEGQQFLVADTNIVCSKDDLVYPWIVFAAVLGIVFVIAFIAWMTITILTETKHSQQVDEIQRLTRGGVSFRPESDSGRRRRISTFLTHVKTLGPSDETMQQLPAQFLYDSFDSHARMFECWRVMRKCVFAMLILIPYAETQALLAMLFLSMSCTFTAYLRPFRKNLSIANTLDIYQQLVLLAVVGVSRIPYGGEPEGERLVLSLILSVLFAYVFSGLMLRVWSKSSAQANWDIIRKSLPRRHSMHQVMPLETITEEESPTSKLSPPPLMIPERKKKLQQATDTAEEEEAAARFIASLL